jgi:transposase
MRPKPASLPSDPMFPPLTVRKTEGMVINDCFPTETATLQRLTTAQLKMLLQKNKILHRSKLKTKSQMITALLPYLHLNGVKVADPPKSEESPPLSTPSPGPKIPIRSTHALAGRPRNEIVARRYNEPVMGIDIHKDTLAYAIVNPSTIVQAGEIENSDDGVTRLLNIGRKYGVVMVGMESTSEYWLPVHWTFQSAGIPTLIANPQQTKATQGVKTDPLDAQRIAFALRDGRLKPSVVCTPEQYALRKDLREMVHQIDAASAVKNRIQQIFHKARAGKEVPKYLSSVRGRIILTGIADARTEESVYKVVKDAYAYHRGKTADPQKLKPLTREMWSFVQALDRLNDRLRFFALVDELYTHQAREHELLLEALRFAKTHLDFRRNLELLISIPSIGIQTAAIALAEIVDINFFPTVKKLTKWAGLVPRTNQSGYKKRRGGKIYKGGNKYLRRAVWLAAQSDFRFGTDPAHPVGGQIRRLKVDKNKKYKQAVTAGAHKLLRIIYGVLMTQQSFHTLSDPDDQQRLVRSTHRKIDALDRTLQIIPTQDCLPLLLERLQQTMERAERARKEIEICYKVVYQKDPDPRKLGFETE